jgi:amino acid transporter
LTIIGLIIVGIVITSGGGPNHETIGFRYWRETGGFVQYAGIAGAWGRFLGFFSGMSKFDMFHLRRERANNGDTLVLISAAFAFIGTEITAIAAAETGNVSYYSMRL